MVPTMAFEMPPVAFGVDERRRLGKVVKNFQSIWERPLIEELIQQSHQRHGGDRTGPRRTAPP